MPVKGVTELEHVVLRRRLGTCDGPLRHAVTPHTGVVKSAGSGNLTPIRDLEFMMLKLSIQFHAKHTRSVRNARGGG
jgi:hypothetical protein